VNPAGKGFHNPTADAHPLGEPIRRVRVFSYQSRTRMLVYLRAGSASDKAAPELTVSQVLPVVRINETASGHTDLREIAEHGVEGG